jgi:hypothetical protein
MRSFLILILLSIVSPILAADTPQTYLTQLQTLFPPSPPFNRWQATSHELPPDFSTLPSSATLPDPLLTPAGTHITSPTDWPPERAHLLSLFEHWYWGSIPPAPQTLSAQTLSESTENNITDRKVLLTFGPKPQAHLHLELLLPHTPAPHPLFLTQHTQRPWALIALSRGYAACIYDGSDDHDDTDSFIAAYPDYDFAQLARRAFAASRALDYCLALPDINPNQIALAGHSRNAKQSLIAAALDPRISLVLVGSSGQGGAAPARFQGEPQSAESIESMTRNFPQWYHPRLRFFAGRESQLPIDANTLLSLIAPRPCLLSTAINDPYDLSPAVQASYLAALSTYHLFHADDNLLPLWRTGAHDISPETVEQYLDFADTHFHRANHSFTAHLLYPPLPDLPSSRFTPHVSFSLSSLGTPPPHLPTTQSTLHYGQDPPFLSSLLNRLPTTQPTDYDRTPTPFGPYLAADLYTPPNASTSHKHYPAILFLHPFSSSRGYSGSLPLITLLARHGFVVLAFDQIAHGSRIPEAEHFFDRYPHWSLLGKMLSDSSDALNTLLSLPYIDPHHTYVVGYSLGSTVGLHLLASDPRLTGGAFASPSLNSPTHPGSLPLYPLTQPIPPYSLSTLITACQPHPLLLITPTLDRNAAPFTVPSSYSTLTQSSPQAFDNFNAATRESILHWLLQQTR